MSLTRRSFVKKSAYSAAAVSVLGVGTGLGNIASSGKLHLLTQRLFIIDYGEAHNIGFSCLKSDHPSEASAILASFQNWESNGGDRAETYTEQMQGEIIDSYYYFDEDPGIVNEWSYQGVDPDGEEENHEVNPTVETNPDNPERWKVVWHFGELDRMQLYCLLTVRHTPTP